MHLNATKKLECLCVYLLLFFKINIVFERAFINFFFFQKQHIILVLGEFI